MTLLDRYKQPLTTSTDFAVSGQFHADVGAVTIDGFNLTCDV
jgi:hypothetical protein